MITDWPNVSAILEAAYYVVALFGLIPAVAIFLWKTRQEIRENHEKVYNELDKIYYEINRTILAHPHLGTTWSEEAPQRVLNEHEQIQQDIIYDMLTSMFEKAYIAYDGISSSVRLRQWTGWLAFISAYCKKEAYRDWWRRNVEYNGNMSFFDRGFEQFMQQLMDASDVKSANGTFGSQGADISIADRTPVTTN